MNEKSVDQLLVDYLFSQPATNVYTLLDGASVEQLPQLLWELEPENICLYRGEQEPDMAAVAPYLVRLERDHRFTKLLCEQGWGNHWGIFVMTPAEVDIRAMRQHFRKFLMVYSHENKLVYFRYYDPRVLRVYLPTCNAEELEIVFGPISAYVLEDEDPVALLLLSSDGRKVLTKRVHLSPSQARV